MNEFGTQAYSRSLRIVMRVAAVFLLIGFIATWVILMNYWPKLDVGRVYLYTLLFVGYLVAERRTFRGPDEDAYTERMWVRYVLTYAWWFLVLGSLLEHALTLRSNSTVTIVGIVLAVAGILLDLWAGNTLSKSLGKRIDTWREMRIIETGPYRWIRHPSYAASMLVVVGLPLVMNAYYSLLLSAVLIVLFMQRLLLEETFLAQRLPTYAAYVQRTHRLIPGIW